MIILNKDFYLQGVVALAKDLIGCILLHDDGVTRRSGIIVETEAYTEDDPASHAFKGITRRNRQMFEEGGTSYVYLIYGLYYCFNVAAGPKGRGEAVLIRALKPLEGIPVMQRVRNTRDVQNLCSGPGKLCLAFEISMEQNGMSLIDSSLQIAGPAENEKYEIETSYRIGLSKATEKKWRFYVKDSQWVSR